jgi:hypothetical protein
LYPTHGLFYLAVAKTKQIKATQNKQRPAKQSNAKQRQIHYSKAKTNKKQAKKAPQIHV